MIVTFSKFPLFFGSLSIASFIPSVSSLLFWPKCHIRTKVVGLKGDIVKRLAIRAGLHIIFNIFPGEIKGDATVFIRTISQPGLYFFDSLFIDVIIDKLIEV